MDTLFNLAENLKNHSLFHGTYLYRLYMGVHLGGGGAIQRDILPVFLPPAIMNTPMIFFEWQHSIRSKNVS